MGSEALGIRERLVLAKVTEDWQTTAEIARRLDVKWEPGEHGDLREVRDDLHRLELRELVEHEPQHGGHLWRLKEPSNAT